MGQPVPVFGTGRSRRGFTMLEMMVVIVIVGILSVMAYSGWTKVMWLVQAKGSADEFRNAILLARADAMARRHNSGVYLDSANHCFLRFVDSIGNDQHYGVYKQGDKILQNWDTLPSHASFYSMSSSMSPDPPPLTCTPASAPLTQSGKYSIVFRPDGRCWARFQAKFGVANFPGDTFAVGVLPATGLVTMEH